MLQWIDELWIHCSFAGIWQVIGHLKLRLPRAQRKYEGVTSLLRLRRGLNIDALSARGLRLRVVNLGTFGKIELEVRVVHLRARRLGCIVHGKNPRHTHASLLSLD